MAKSLPIRVKLNKGMPTISQVGADRVHIFYGEIAFGPSSIIGSSTRCIFTDAELLEFRDRITLHLQAKGVDNVEGLDSAIKAVSGVHPPGQEG